MTEHEIMFQDRESGALEIWTKKEEKAFVEDCQNRLRTTLRNTKKYCRCAKESMKTGINYERYRASTDYQKGKITGLHGGKCEAISLR